ncbi:hypothetical protein CQ015_11230 [Arthrobacter sp. MYb221]|nr:hypothetical protein CQ015_11230 [Arthrobacter sp. MYb221]
MERFSSHSGHSIVPRITDFWPESVVGNAKNRPKLTLPHSLTFKYSIGFDRSKRLDASLTFDGQGQNELA